jgi:hypothetical protein
MLPIQANQLTKPLRMYSTMSAHHRGHPVTTKKSGSTTVLFCRFHDRYGPGPPLPKFTPVLCDMLMFEYHRTYLPTGALHTAREYTFLPFFIPSQHLLFKIHTHIASREFIFINFAPSPTPSIPFSIQFDSDFDLTLTPTLSNPQ